MRCLVCGVELNQVTTCPVCGEKVVGVVGNMTPELQQKFANAGYQKRINALSGVTAYLRSYYWQDVNGELAERGRQDIPIGQNLGALGIEQVLWGNTEFARQAAGEELELTVVLKDTYGRTSEQKTKVVAPSTDGLWRIGCVLKPGFRMAIRVGNERVYSDSGEIDLRG